MSLKSLMERLQNRAADTPDTPEKITGYQRKASTHAGCTPDTPDTPCFGDTPENLQVGPIDEAVSDPPPEPPADPNAWRELAVAYHAHHLHCTMCIAAGRGAVYGLRCGVGVALWNTYQST